ncbi:MAG: hypothetical protein LH613_12865, partial [Chamaesiphon sp.]|nr:hypothetical protein [Chamaesiphon sp.]
ALLVWSGSPPSWETPRTLGGFPAHQHFSLNPLCDPLRVGRACALRLRQKPTGGESLSTINYQHFGYAQCKLSTIN